MIFPLGQFASLDGEFKSGLAVTEFRRLVRGESPGDPIGNVKVLGIKLDGPAKLCHRLAGFPSREEGQAQSPDGPVLRFQAELIGQ